MTILVRGRGLSACVCVCVHAALLDIFNGQWESLKAITGRVSAVHAAADQLREQYIAIRGVRALASFALASLSCKLLHAHSHLMGVLCVQESAKELFKEKKKEADGTAFALLAADFSERMFCRSVCCH